jgi:nicotinamidase-related amidase
MVRQMPTTRSSNRPDRDSSLLLVVDIQTRLAPHVLDHEALLARVHALISAAELFGIPTRATEHCPEQIGPVVTALRSRFADDHVFVKTRFGACDHEAFVAMLRASGRTHVVVAGMEAHVCVMQTVLGLIAHGFTATAVQDAIGSRSERQQDRSLALARMHDAGTLLAGTETVLFEWIGAGDDPRFRTLLPAIKALP